MVRLARLLPPAAPLTTSDPVKVLLNHWIVPCARPAPITKLSAFSVVTPLPRLRMLLLFGAFDPPPVNPGVGLWSPAVIVPATMVLLAARNTVAPQPAP